MANLDILIHNPRNREETRLCHESEHYKLNQSIIVLCVCMKQRGGVWNEGGVCAVLIPKRRHGSPSEPPYSQGSAEERVPGS